MAPAILNEPEVPITPLPIIKELSGATNSAKGVDSLTTALTKLNGNGAVKAPTNGHSNGKTDGFSDGLDVAKPICFFPTEEGSSDVLRVLDYNPAMLNDASAIEWIAGQLHKANIVNSHQLHKLEVHHVETEHVQDAEYMQDILELKRTKHTSDESYIKLRTSMTKHLRKAQADSEGLMVTIAKLSDELSLAKRAEALAKADSKAAHALHQQLKAEIETVRHALTHAREQLIKLVKERDDAVLESDKAEGLLNIRDAAVARLDAEVERLVSQVDSLRVKLSDAIKARNAAALDELKTRQQLTREQDTCSTLRKRVAELEHKHEAKAESIRGLEATIHELRAQLTHARTKVKEALEDKEGLKTRFRELEDQIRDAVEAASAANDTLDVAKKQLEEAISTREHAEEQRTAAEIAWTRAELEKQDAESRHRAIREQFMKLEADYAQEQREKATLKEKLSKAEQRAELACHFTQEAIEWGQALNLTNHELFEQYKKSYNEKVQAIELRFAEGRERADWQEQARLAQAKVRELTEAFFSVSKQKDRAQNVLDEFQKQYNQLKEGHLHEQLGSQNKIDHLQKERMRWEKVRSKLNTEIDMAKIQVEKAEAAKMQAEVARQKAEAESAEEARQHEKELEEAKARNQRMASGWEEINRGNKARIEELLKKTEEKEATIKELGKDIADIQKVLSHGHSFGKIAIHDIFLGGQRVQDDSIYQTIGKHYGSVEKLPLVRCFPDEMDKKKKLAVVYTVKGEEIARTVEVGVNEGLKFPASSSTTTAAPATKSTPATPATATPTATATTAATAKTPAKATPVAAAPTTSPTA
ncbi:uncharacterized protein BO95DRAFT_466978 [Aspergillus brunneoviolaceus CBS 621.78]|uniref:Uncharacterized protein n=1 Tax=Aspergillus brunneoviolaceus CBS 621.78 TaxID=1450534 RepID=A0ACD1FZJ5_9EURO|nr:hypothetical protein BO95DRAFT_466978 [Aspergillus brunneoviolaceus CBS 621.78]RAH42331.1 hypothetical protein BO95DRAFT_466978 [Aspergillus brunneoviolaceus CBS 621.78]